ncbi:MAG: alpha-amylase family glycosyl hydrolase, partial [Acidimicrobiia bacterium]
HLAWLGVDALWICPVTVSPDDDWGYDVSDYLDVHPELGTLADLDELIAEAKTRGLAVLLDLVPNHTSERHPWFVDSRSSLTSAHRDWYVWVDPKPDGSPPNNWLGTFGGPAWTLDEMTGQSYLHNFLSSQPDLNWWNQEVRDAFDEILRFWFDRGVAGFRIDVCHMIVKDAALRDNPPATDEDHPYEQAHGQRKLYNADRPELHDVLRRWRRLADTYEPPRALVGETYLMDVGRLARFYGGGEELHLAINFVLLHSRFEAGAISAIVEATESSIQAPATPAWVISSHDISRSRTRWCRGRQDAARCALMALLTLRGTAILYYGDELAMPDTELSEGDLLDPVSQRRFPAPGRDQARTPMPWTADGGAGFTGAGNRPWLPIGDQQACNVSDQRDDPESTLHLCRDLLTLRRQRSDLRHGFYEALTSPPGIWAFRRGATTAVAINLSDDPLAFEGISGTVLLGTSRALDAQTLHGRLELAALEGAVIELTAP